MNAPDDWERSVLTAFEERKASAEPVKTMAFAEVTKDGNGQVYLACHRNAITPEVEAALSADYPDDQARGYKLGDIRGALTLSKPR